MARVVLEGLIRAGRVMLDGAPMEELTQSLIELGIRHEDGYRITGAVEDGRAEVESKEVVDPSSMVAKSSSDKSKPRRSAAEKDTDTDTAPQLALVDTDAAEPEIEAKPKAKTKRKKTRTKKAASKAKRIEPDEDAGEDEDESAGTDEARSLDPDIIDGCGRLKQVLNHAEEVGYTDIDDIITATKPFRDAAVFAKTRGDIDTKMRRLWEMQMEKRAIVN